MAGEQSQSEVTAENFPLHFAIAQKYGGSVHAFDQYQGPYIRIPATAQNLPKEAAHHSHKLWLSSTENAAEGWAVIYNETLDKPSEPFWGGVYFKSGTREVDEERGISDALKAAEQALTPRDPAKKRYKVKVNVSVMRFATVEVEAGDETEAMALARECNLSSIKFTPDWQSADFPNFYEPEEVMTDVAPEDIET